MVNILLIDDDQEYLNITKMYLKDCGLRVTVCNNPIDALELCKRERIGIILLDYYMPEMNGDEFVEKLREFDDSTIVIMQTGYSEQKPPLETLVNLNIQGYHDKDKGVDDLLLTILSTIKTINLLLYKANKDTKNIEYSFMSLSDTQIDKNDSKVDLDFDDKDLVGYELIREDNYGIGRNGFVGIEVTNVTDKDEYERLKSNASK